MNFLVCILLQCKKIKNCLLTMIFITCGKRYAIIQNYEIHPPPPSFPLLAFQKKLKLHKNTGPGTHMFDSRDDWRVAP